MSGATGGQPNQNFHDRLARVAEARAPIEAARPQVSAVPDWKDNLRYPVSLVGAACLGMLAVFVARYARFHLLGGTISGDDPDFTMVIDAVLAGMCSFAIFSLMGFTAREQRNIERERAFGFGGFGDTPIKSAQLFGIFFMIGVMHNFVHIAPGAFSAIFSDDWAEEVTMYSEPGSIYFRGNYFKVISGGEDTEVADEPEEKALPKVRRMG